MTAISGDSTATGGVRFQPGDIAALIGALAIVIGYVALPFATNFGAGFSGAAFTDARTTFLALTFVAGLVGVISVVAGVTALQERGIRWWYFGLGLLALVLFVDNFLLHDRFLTRNTANGVGIWKVTFDTGGMIMLVGAVLLVAQAALPRRDAAGSRDRTADTVLGLIRIVVATLWFTQLLWKLPWNNYGCPAGALTPAAGTSGLCDWVGREIAEPRYGFYDSFLRSVIAPNLGGMAFFILAGEAFIAFSLMLGLFTRLGALAGALMGVNLFIGLTAVRNPFEWDWTYLMLPAINAVFIVVGGRWVGLDALLHPRFRRMVEAKKGGIVARLLAWLTA